MAHSASKQPAVRPEQLTPELEREIAEVEVLVGRILLVGVIVSTALIVIGAALTLAQHETQLAFQVASFPAAVAAMRTLRGWAIIDLGLLLLILTPAMRVAVSILGFARCRDRVFTVVTCFVLGVLILGFLIGKGEAH